MSSLRASAIVLRQIDYSETSQVLVFYTREHGKVRAIGKGLKRGTKKRFAVGIDLLDAGQIVVYGRHDRAGLSTLSEWKQTRSWIGLRDSLSRLRAAEYAAEITDGLTEDWDPHPEIHDGLTAVLDEVSEAADPCPGVVRFQWSLLDSIGLLPRFDCCLDCGRGDDLSHFSTHQGGMICRHCEARHVEKWEVSHAALQELQVIPRSGGHAVCALLNYHIAHLMGRQPRLWASLSQPPKGPPVGL